MSAARPGQSVGWAELARRPARRTGDGPASSAEPIRTAQDAEAVPRGHGWESDSSSAAADPSAAAGAAEQAS